MFGLRTTRFSLAIAASAALLALAGCGGAAEQQTSEQEADLDTSGCSGLETSKTSGPVTVSSARPPRASCWNVSESGITLTYAWFQTNDSKAEKSIGFWTSLNGEGVYAKADSASCSDASSFGYGADTSGNRTYRCTATKTFSFANYPSLQRWAYDGSGGRNHWDVQVAVSLDDSGSWDSLGGNNYKFTL